MNHYTKCTICGATVETKNYQNHCYTVFHHAAVREQTLKLQENQQLLASLRNKQQRIELCLVFNYSLIMLLYLVLLVICKSVFMLYGIPSIPFLFLYNSPHLICLIISLWLMQWITPVLTKAFDI